MAADPTPAPLPGFLLVVGGQCRKVGKSALVEDIIRAFPDRNWAAVKITPYAESGCPVNGQTCDCAADEHPYAIHEEAKHAGTADTLRFLAAGARRALWLETKENRLSDALPALQAKIANAKHVIIESDAIMKFWKPSLFLIVLDPGNPDFKSSARENLSLADGFVYRSPFAPAGLGIAVAQKPQFLQTFGSPLPLELRQFLSGSIS